MNLSFFPALFDKPDSVHFSEVEDSETVEIFLRQYWITNLNWIIGFLFMSLIPVLGLDLAWIFFKPELRFIPLDIIISATILWYLLSMFYLLQSFLHWYFNCYIVTNLHIIQVHFYNLFRREITQAELSDIQSVKSVQQGFNETFLNFGDVIMETAAENQSVEFVKIPDPVFVADRIQSLKESMKK